MGGAISCSKDADTVREVARDAAPQAPAQAAPNLRRIAVGDLAMGMEEHLKAMSIGARHISVVWNKDVLAVPYKAADSQKSEVIQVGERRLSYVGFTKLEEIADAHFLVSDSYASCVPVVLFNKSTTWLAHSVGTNCVLPIVAGLSRTKGSQVIVVRKARESANYAKANAIAEQLMRSQSTAGAPDFTVHIADVPTIQGIAVVVSQVHQRVMIYPLS